MGGSSGAGRTIRPKRLAGSTISPLRRGEARVRAGSVGGGGRRLDDWSATVDERLLDGDDKRAEADDQE